MVIVSLSLTAGLSLFCVTSSSAQSRPASAPTQSAASAPASQPAARQAAVVVDDLSVEVHHRVVEYYKPKTSEASELETSHDVEDQKYVLVFCQLSVPAGPKAEQFRRDVKNKNAITLFDAAGTAYPCIGNAQNNYRGFGQVVMQVPFWSSHVQLEPGKKKTGYSWLFLLPNKVTSGRLKITGLEGSVPAVIERDLSIPESDTKAEWPQFTILDKKILSGSDLGLKSKPDAKFMVLKCQVKCSLDRKSFVLNTFAVTLQTSSGGAIYPAGEVVKGSFVGFGSHVVRTEDSGTFEFCFDVPADNKDKLRLSFAGRAACDVP